MTREEAIKLLVNATYSDEWQGNEQLTKANLMAIEALKAEGVGRYENAMQKLREMPRYLNGVKAKQMGKERAMTREEAIKWIEDITLSIRGSFNRLMYQEEKLEALDMAIEALQEQKHDGCEGCKYTDKNQYGMLCLMCKRSKEDLWERREP